MADDSVVVDDDDESKIVTKFLFNTCRLLQPSEDRVRGIAICAELSTYVARESIDDNILSRMCTVDEFHLIPLLTGSSAEFYIQPMMSCVGDNDIMVYYSNDLAIPDGYPPPTELPAEFRSRVGVYEIVDSEYPGYVYLMPSYLLTEDRDTGKYNAVRCDKRQVVFTDLRYLPVQAERHGPAATYVGTEHGPTCHVTVFIVYDVCRGRHKPQIGQHDTETTTGQTQQLLIRLSTTVVMLFMWHILIVDKMRGRANISVDCHFHEQRLYC